MLAGAPTGLYGHVEENRKRSLLLFGGFLVAIELMAFVALTGPTLMFDLDHSPVTAPLGYLRRYFLPVALVGLIVFAAKYWWFVGAVKKSVGFRYVDNADEPRFCRILEPLAIAAGIPTPFAAVVESPALNAFACGVRARHMVVVATRGLLDSLDDDELGAVLAHEVMHIKNRDTTLLASANTFMATLTLARGRRTVKLDDPRHALGMVMMPVMIPVVLLASFLTQLALRIGYCSRTAIGSAREYIADAEAVRLTQNPAALVSALRKIEGRSRIESIGQAEEAMMIDGPVEGPLATHPSVSERIAALARTTGSMIFEAGTRLDTRTGAAARVAGAQGFGRKTDELMRIATLSEAPPRAGLWEVFRKTRDPERNIFGFNGRAVVLFGVVLLAIGGIYQTSAGARYFNAQRNIVMISGDVSAATKKLASCELSVLGAVIGVTGTGCDSKGLNATSDQLMGHFGLPTAKEQGASRAAQDAAMIESKLRRRCFADRFNMTPAALEGRPQGRGSGQSLELYLRGADASGVRVLSSAIGPAQDEQLRDYVAMRKLLLNDALYFFGRPGLDAINLVYRHDDHQRVLALLGERLKDPAFTAGQNPYKVGDAKLFVMAPFEALPCDVLK